MSARRRWPLVLAILAVVVVVVVVLALLIVWWKRDDNLSDARANWQPPEQSFLPPLSVRPVAGWRTSVTDLGLPGPTPGVSGQSMIAASNERFGPKTYVGSSTIVRIS